MDLSKLSRRDFIRSAALGTAGITLAQFPARSFAFGGKDEPQGEPQDNPLYRFVLLGDTHYDRSEHHDMDWVRSNQPNDVNQIKRYVENSQKNTPALLERARQVIAASELRVPFVLQVGDLVEGLCGNYKLAAKQFDDVTGLIDQTNLGAPFLMCKGNHDITGPGAADAYDKVLLPWLSKQGGQKLTTAHFSARFKGDLFVFFDAFRPNLDWLQKEFARSADARHTFVILHTPVVPYDARANWTVYGTESARPLRQRMIELLAKRKAIVLSGHLHKYGLVEHATSKGRFTQLAVSSVVSHDPPKVRDEQSGVEAYTQELVSMEPNFSPATKEQRMQLLEAERPYVRRFEYADLPGLAVVDVHETGVSCQVFGGTDETPYRSTSLTADAGV